MSSAETSDHVASIAARLLRMTDDDVTSDVNLLRDAKIVAASALRQHEGHEVLFIPSEINFDKIANAMIGVIEGGYSPWVHEFHSADDPGSATSRRAIQLNDGIWYASASYWRDDGKADIIYDLEAEDEGAAGGRITIGKAEIISGLCNMARLAPKHFADLVNEEDDAITHDVFIQFVVFGKIVYG